MTKENDRVMRSTGEMEEGRSHHVRVSPGPRLAIEENGFTLLEVLVAVSILGISIAIVLQLFSANLRTMTASGDYVLAAAKAEAKMREVLDDQNTAERSLNEITNDGYRITVSVTNALQKRTENLPVTLLDISLTVRWTRGVKEGSVILRTMKMVSKQI